MKPTGLACDDSVRLWVWPPDKVKVSESGQVAEVNCVYKYGRYENNLVEKFASNVQC